MKVPTLTFFKGFREKINQFGTSAHTSSALRGYFVFCRSDMGGKRQNFFISCNSPLPVSAERRGGKKQNTHEEPPHARTLKLVNGLNLRDEIHPLEVTNIYLYIRSR